MKRCAFLTFERRGHWVIDDELAYTPLGELGWEVESVPWRRPDTQWSEFDAVVIRSTWDYQHDPDGFLAVLERIERTEVPLFNSLDIVRWNLQKSYLRDLEAEGVAIPPTVWRDGLAAGDLAPLHEEVGTAEIVVKPLVGASADGAFRLDRAAAHDRAGEVEEFYAGRGLLAQPFARAVLTEGEYSLFFLNGEHSHTIVKIPKGRDFRAQEEHGGRIRATRADDALRAAGARALRAIPEPSPLYARTDFIRSNDGDGFWLTELELIEPSLYLRMDPGAPARLARAIDDRARRRAAEHRPRRPTS